MVPNGDPSIDYNTERRFCFRTPEQVRKLSKAEMAKRVIKVSPMSGTLWHLVRTTFRYRIDT